MTDADVTLRDYIEARFVEVERSVAREVAVLRTLMAEHASAHAREHAMSQIAIDKAQEVTTQQFESERDATHAMFDQMQRAVERAERTQVEKFASVNEFRAVLTDQAGTFVRRDFVDQMQDTLEKTIHDLREQFRAEVEKGRLKTEALEKESRFNEGRTIGISLAVSGVVTIVGIGLSVLFFVLR